METGFFTHQGFHLLGPATLFFFAGASPVIGRACFSSYTAMPEASFFHHTTPPSAPQKGAGHITDGNNKQFSELDPGVFTK